jgi:hypothetical protein
MRNKVEFATNVPTAVMLDGLGTEQQNKAGEPEYRYFLDADSIMWVPPQVHGEIEQLQRRYGVKGLEIAITKQQAKRGAPIRWTVEHIADEPDSAQAVRAAATAPSSRAPLPPPTPATSNGHRPPAARPAPTPVPPPYTADAPLTLADQLAGCLAAAIDAAAEAAIYAERHGMTLRWDAGDIRAMAATLLIGEQKGGRI